jgi:hypothetical protein
VPLMAAIRQLRRIFCLIFRGYRLTNSNLVLAVSNTMQSIYREFVRSSPGSNSTDKLARYIGSADSARDLNRIITLIGGNKLRTMNFYGYSTVLGTTYAAMFPNGFDRMLLDGVVNTPKLYLVGDNGPSSIIDAKKGEQVFFDSCSAAGACPASGFNGNCCPFWAATPALVQV